MVVEIEYYKGDVLLYGNDIGKHDLKKQLIEVENSYDLPDFTYDRDTGLLLG